MPKKVDHQERRERIASALIRVVAHQGLQAVSLRHVAAEAGVTSGMVQHYFRTKEEMMDFAMAAVRERVAERMNEAVTRQGENPSPRDLVAAMLTELLPREEAERADGRVALAFLAYATSRPAAAEALGTSNAQMRAFLAAQIRAAQDAGQAAPGVDPEHAATGLFALVEGLAVHALGAGLPTEAAMAAFHAQLDLVLGPRRGG